jgi:hypothetical protein
LRLPLREVALMLSRGDVHRVLNETPEPFATANREKRAALSHFQPHGVLISHGPERADRRRFNEDVLDTGRPVHSLGETFAAKIAEEVDAMQREAAKIGSLDWDVFARGWWRMVRRVALGDGARDDHDTGMASACRTRTRSPRRSGNQAGGRRTGRSCPSVRDRDSARVAISCC